MINMKAVGKRSLEWDLDDWKWDGDLFRANPLNPGASDRSSSQCFPLVPELQLAVNTDGTTSMLPCSEETNPINGNVLPCSEETNVTSENITSESLKKKRIVVAQDDDELNDEVGQLNLKLGEQIYPIMEVEADKREGESGQISKNAGSSHPVCLVEGCIADLRNARDYNRRHKVCEVHSKASEALVANVVQRFCQQCSRFHALQEFDGDKRSCRKRLAGHNKRRRKTHPETCLNSGSVTNEVNAGQILNLLIRILSNMHTNGSTQAKDQDLLSLILRNLATDGSNTSRLLQGSQGSPNVETFNVIPEEDHSRNQEPRQTARSAQKMSLMRDNQVNIPRTTSIPQPEVLQATGGTLPVKELVQEATVEKCVLGGIDLNNVYNEDSQDCINGVTNGDYSVTGTYRAQQTLPSPPQNSGNSASTSGRSSSTSGEAQCRTDRIVFKLFDKNPNDLPNVLRTQILDWLSHSPTDIEGYIRPGCIVLTLYLRLNTLLWEQLCSHLSSNLIRLLDISDDPFWETGWIYTRIKQRAAFIYDGQVILDTPLPLRSRILSISPIALPAGETVKLVVRSSNVSGPTSRLFCAIEGRYMVEDNCDRLLEGTEVVTEQDDIKCLSFSCSIPNVIGRGFIEVEDYDLTGCFFPFIVAEPEVCHEICMLEREMEVCRKDECNQGEDDRPDAKYQALDFVHEMGWLLHRDNVRSKKKQHGSTLNDLFPFERLKWLVEFSMDHEWCAVLKKLMDLLFSGIVGVADYASIEDGVADIALLHTAVRRNSRPMVKFLLRYVPNRVDNGGLPSRMLFRPDVVGAGGLTPLHIAASSTGLEDVLDALLEDPGMVGIEAWKNARDSTGLTPCDYASLRGHYRYLNLVQKKIDRKSPAKHVVFNIPDLPQLESNQTQTDKAKWFDSFYTEKTRLSQSCKFCDQTPDYRFGAAPLTFRPVMISLVAIAVVCVCTALLFKSEPQVCGIFGPFRWESLKFGAI